MKAQLMHILKDEHVLAFALTAFAFFVMIFLVRAQRIKLLGALLFLVVSLLVGLIIDHAHDLKGYFYHLPSFSSEVPASSTATLVASSRNSQVDHDSFSNSSELSDQIGSDFQKQVLQAIENLKVEVSTEKENLGNVMSQIKELFDSVDIQKQKLQQFIEESHERFKADAMQQSSSELEN